MRTNIEIDDALIAQAMALTGLATRRATVEAALRLLVKMQAQQDLKSLRGKVEFYDDYDYKAMRGTDLE